jgi:hypothetical protein
MEMDTGLAPNACWRMNEQPGPDGYWGNPQIKKPTCN